MTIESDNGHKNKYEFIYKEEYPIKQKNTEVFEADSIVTYYKYDWWKDTQGTTKAMTQLGQRGFCKLQASGKPAKSEIWRLVFEI